MRSFGYVAARALAVLVVALFALFVLAGLFPRFEGWDVLSHAVGTLAVLGATLIAWRRPKIGGWFFIILGVVFFTGALSGDWVGLLIGAVPFIAGVLFLREGPQRGSDKTKPRRERGGVFQDEVSGEGLEDDDDDQSDDENDGADDRKKRIQQT